MFCFCGSQASWECTREDAWCQHPETESQPSWPPPNLITHPHFSIISTAASAPHGKPAWGLIGWKINPESEEEERVVGSFASTRRAVTCKQLSWHCWTGGRSLWGALSRFVSKGFAPWIHKLSQYIDALLVSLARHRPTSISTLSAPLPRSKQSTYFKFFSPVETGFHPHIPSHCSLPVSERGQNRYIPFYTFSL